MRRVITIGSLLILAGCNAGATGGGTGESATGEATTGASAPEAKTGAPLVTFDGRTAISVEDFKDRLMKQSPFLRARYAELDKKKEFLDNMVRFELLAEEANRRGLADDPEVKEVMKKVMVQKLVRQLDTEGAKDVPEEELRAYYDKNIDDYVKPERVRVSHVFVAAAAGDAKARAAAKKKAEALYAELAKGKEDHEHFRRIAREKSEDAASRPLGGDLRYLTAEELTFRWGQAVADAAFDLKTVGALSPVVEGEKGFHVLKLSGRQKALDRTFEQVRKAIEMRVGREKRSQRFDEFVGGLKEQAKIEVKEDVLDQISVTGAGVEPGDPAMPHGGMPGPGQLPAAPTGMRPPAHPTTPAAPAPAPAPAEPAPEAQ